MRSLGRSIAIGAVAAVLLAPHAVARVPVPAQVTEVTSGATLDARAAGGSVVHVRQIGIDAPGAGDRALRASAVAFVRRYYRLISRHRYAAAWRLLPRGVRRDLGGSFAVWKAGHRGSIGASVRSARARMSHGRAVVAVVLRGGQRDVCSGRVVRMRFRGRWVLARRDDGRVAVAQHIHKVAGGRVRLTRSECAPPPPPEPVDPGPPAPPPRDCQGYSPCIPPGPDVDCEGGSGDGPRYTGPVSVTGGDPYGLDGDGDGLGCEA